MSRKKCGGTKFTRSANFQNNNLKQYAYDIHMYLKIHRISSNSLDFNSSIELYTHGRCCTIILLAQRLLPLNPFFYY